MGLLDALQDPQFRQDVGRGLLDAGNRGLVGGLLGAPVDLLTAALRPLGYRTQAPVGGSEWIGQKMQGLGAVSTQRNPMAEALAGLIDPATLGAGALKALPMVAGMAARPKYWDSLVDVLKAGQAADVPFGKVAAHTEQRVNALRQVLDQPLVQRGDQWVIPQNVVQKLIDKRMGQDGMSAEKVADTLNSAVHSTRNRVFQSEYPQIQGLLTPKEGFSNLGFVGVNPRTGDPVIKSGYKLETDRGDKAMNAGNSLWAGRSSAIAKADESASYRSAIPEHTGNAQSMPQSGYSPQYQAALDAGLDMSYEARMKRAAEQGYVMPGWHGTDKNITDHIRRSKTGAMGPAAYVGDHPGVADTYAGDGPGANILPVLVRGPFAGNRQWTELVNQHGWAGAEAAARKAGINAVHDGQFESALAVFDPANIRSVNAAFNPANLGKPDLLGRVDPALLPWLGAGALGAYATQKGLLSE